MTPLQKEERRARDLAWQRARRSAIKAVTVKPKKDPKKVISTSSRRATDKWQEANPEKVKANQKRCYERSKLASQERIALAMAQVNATIKKIFR